MWKNCVSSEVNGSSDASNLTFGMCPAGCHVSAGLWSHGDLNPALNHLQSYGCCWCIYANGTYPAAGTLPLCHHCTLSVPCCKKYLTCSWAPTSWFSASSLLPACIPLGAVGLSVSSTAAFMCAGARVSEQRLAAVWYCRSPEHHLKRPFFQGALWQVAHGSCWPPRRVTHVPCSALDLTGPLGKQEPPSSSHRNIPLLGWAVP